MVVNPGHQGCGARKPLLSDVDEVDGENRSKGLRPDSFTFTFADLNGGRLFWKYPKWTMLLPSYNRLF